MSLNAYSSIFSLFTHCAELISAFGLISPFTSPQYTFARSMSPLCGVIPTKSLKYLMFDTSTKGNSSFISLCRQSISDSPSMGFPPGKIQVSFFFTRRISLSLIANTFIAILSMSQWPESNRRPTRYECVALPTELHWQTNGFPSQEATRIARLIFRTIKFDRLTSLTSFNFCKSRVLLQHLGN